MQTVLKILVVLLFWIGIHPTISGQERDPPKVAISLSNDRFYERINNPLNIVAQQKDPVSLDQLEAYLIIDDSIKKPLEIIDRTIDFVIRPDTIGNLVIKIKVGDVVETRMYRVHPIKIVGWFGGYRGVSSGGGKMRDGQFKTQRGIVASIECCRISGHVPILGFHLIRIDKSNQVERSINTGATFGEESREIINRAQSGDIYIFRNIRYTCPSSGNPKRLDDIVVEVK